ncbi:MAG: DUF1963 domain-containing protein [Saprospiraceae bacterium]|nr:DUF1963 domain-containing protein [Saprospiraceae bacterium]
MIPSFLEPFRAEIEKYKLETIKIEATPLGEGEVLPIKQSKFLGKPYLPFYKEYPKDRNGAPMILLAQINFEEFPTLTDYPTSGILQLFISSSDWYNMEDFCILFYESPESEFQTEFDFLTDALYEDSPVYVEHKLAFNKKNEHGDPNDFRFQLIFDGKDYYDFQESLTKAQQEEMDSFFSSIGHKIGGYAYFTQSDPRDYDNAKRNDVLLLQIDTDEEIMFGDSGVAHIFINADDLKRKDFSKAYFYWDCC